MEYRALGRSGLRVSALGFGCGNVGGLLVRGGERERERAVARALELGINYFDTAPAYGDGESERQLGQALRALGAQVYVGTKFRLRERAPGALAQDVEQQLDASLARLGRERVELFQLHDAIGSRGVAARDVLGELVPALRKQAERGKLGGFGITALGDAAELLALADSGALASAQICLNLLNPSAAQPLPAGFPAQDFGGLLLRAAASGTGAIAIRVLAGGALSGSAERHPLAAPAVAPIASGRDYASDVRSAQRLQPLVDEGHAASLPEAALRFALSCPAVSTALVGFSSLEQLEAAAASAAKGALDGAALARLPALWARLGAA